MIKLIITLKRREGMTHDEFEHYQRNVHMPLLTSIPEAQRYLRRFVVSYPTPARTEAGASYDSVVEAWFDDVDDMDALYLSDNFVNSVAPDHEKFIDLSAVGRIITEEVVIIG